MSTKTKTAKTPVDDKTPRMVKLSLTDTSVADAVILGGFTFGAGRDVGVVSLSSFNDKPALDLRRFYRNDDDTLCPTAKGVRVPLEVVDDLIKLLVASRATITQYAADAE